MLIPRNGISQTPSSKCCGSAVPYTSERAGLDVPFLDLSGYSGDEKERLTLEAMQRGEPLIYSGRICTCH